MRESMRSVTPRFNTHRMVEEYCTRLYEPAASAAKRLAANSCLPARNLRDWKEHMRRRWETVGFEDAGLDVPDQASVPVGEPVRVLARVNLGEISPEHVRVQACIDRGEGEDVRRVHIADLEFRKSLNGSGFHLFEGSVVPEDSGEFCLTMRIIPTHPLLTQSHELRLIRWMQ